MSVEVKISLLDLSKLDAETLAAYDRMTDEFYRCCLRSKDPWGVEFTEIIAFGATVQDKPVGLALAGFRPVLDTAAIHSVYVVEAYRRQGIGARLFTAAETEIARRKGRLVEFIYLSEQPTSIACEKILQRLGWTPPLPFMARLTFDGFAFNPPWIRRKYTLPKGFEIFPWRNLKAQERARLMHLAEEGGISDQINPLHEEEKIEPINSLGLRHGNDVIGWMITHRLAPDTIQYTSLYIDRDYKFLGHAIKLLVESIHLQKASPVKWAKLNLNLEMIDHSWLSFVRRRLLPYATKVERFKKSGHALRKIDLFRN